MASLAVTTQETPIWDLFFPRHKKEVMKELDPFLTKDTAGIVVSYVLGKENPFGAPEWKKYFGVEIVDPPGLRRSFYTWWFAPDPIDPAKQRCETHLPPVLRPTGMSLKKLGELVNAPKEGHPSKYRADPYSLKQSENIEAGPSVWLVMRKAVFEKNKPYDQQKQFIRALNAKIDIAYEEEPSIIDIATVVFTRHTSTGERYLKACIALGRDFTHSHAKETIQSPWDGDRCQLVIGGFGDSGLNIGHGYHCDTGIIALRKF